MESYIFFFDESFHDRKIRVNKNGTMNILREDCLDNYVGVFWGCKRKELNKYIKALELFESRQKEIYGLSKEQELKSTVISKKNFKYGLRSFNKQTYSFYYDLFSLLEFMQPIIQIELISKMEYYLRNVFSAGKFNSIEPNISTFYYVLTKSILTYHNKELIEALYDTTDREKAEKFRKLLIFNYKCIIDAIQGIERKETELEAMNEIVFLLSSVTFVDTPKREYDFPYFVNFEGLTKLLEEKDVDIDLTDIIIDEEQKTLDSSKAYGFQNVSFNKSDEKIELRLSDWIASFVGRMIFAIVSDKGLHEDSVIDIRDVAKNDLETKRYLSPNWFDLKERDFELYQLLYQVFIIEQGSYWSTMTFSYADQAILFYTLIRYFNKYETFEDYRKIDNQQHAIEYNKDVLIELEYTFENMVWGGEPQ